MIVGFYIESANPEQINSLFNYALLNECVLGNKSFIFFHLDIIKQKENFCDIFKEHFKMIPIVNFCDVDYFMKKHNIKHLYQSTYPDYVEKTSKNAINCLHLLSNPEKIDEYKAEKKANTQTLCAITDNIINKDKIEDTHNEMIKQFENLFLSS